jgi:MFS transporter, FSR family, fosmidomycin resistance protein
VYNVPNFISKRAASSKSRNLLGACLTHMLHDGYTDQLYAFLPVWQEQFGLSYMGLAIVRALYYGTMGGLQVPVDPWTSQWKPRSALALSTFVAAAGFVAMALPAGFAGLCAGLVLAGAGSSLQQPRASQHLRYGIDQAHRAGLDKKSVLNCLPWNALAPLFRR